MSKEDNFDSDDKDKKRKKLNERYEELSERKEDLMKEYDEKQEDNIQQAMLEDGHQDPDSRQYNEIASNNGMDDDLISQKEEVEEAESSIDDLDDNEEYEENLDNLEKELDIFEEDIKNSGHNYDYLEGNFGDDDDGEEEDDE